MTLEELQELWDASNKACAFVGYHTDAVFPEDRDAVSVLDREDGRYYHYKTVEDFWNAWGDWQNYRVIDESK